MTTSSPTARRSEPRAWLFGVLAAAALAVVYFRSPLHPLYDARFALLTSEALLTRGSWNVGPLLHEELLADLLQSDKEDRRFQRHLWQLEPLPDGRVIYRYPPGTPLFSLPFLALARPFGGSTLAAEGWYSRDRETRLQTLLAALVTAAAALAIHRLALFELPVGPATAVTLVAGLGSPLWSTASQSLWPHTWTLLWVALALLEMRRWESAARPRPVLLALLVSAAFWARPTAALVAAPIALFVAWRHRAALPRLVATGATALAGYLLLTRIVWGGWVPGYARVLSQKRRVNLWQPFYAQLLSMRAGLLVYSPILFAVALALVVRKVAPESRPFAGLVVAIVVAHIALYSRWPAHTSGTISQRYLTEVMPCFAWLGAHAWRRVQEASLGLSRSWLRALATRTVVVLLALASVAAHATGVLEMHWKNLYARMRIERQIAAAGGPSPVSGPVRTKDELPQWRMLRWLVTEWWPGPPGGPRR